MKEILARFAEMDKRVRALVEENVRLHEKVRELEEDLDRASKGAHEADALRARKEQVQDRLKRLLHVLDALETREKEKDLQNSERQL